MLVYGIYATNDIGYTREGCFDDVLNKKVNVVAMILSNPIYAITSLNSSVANDTSRMTAFDQKERFA